MAGIVCAGALVVLGVRYLVFGDHSRKLNVKVERITIATVRKGPFLEYIPLIGTVIPNKTVYLDAVEGGRVETIFREAGSYVEKGQKILALSNTNLLLEIMNREADFYQLSNDLRNTQLLMEQNRLELGSKLLELDYRINELKRTQRRERTLFEKNIIAAKQYEDTRNEYEYLQRKRDITLANFKQDCRFREDQIKQIDASLKRLEASLSLAKRKLEDLTLKAPVSGHLTALNAEIGESKQRGERLGQIDVLDGFKLRVSVDEHYIARIQVGQRAEFTFANQVYRLSISKIYPQVIERRFEVDMVFDSAQPEGIKRGQTLHTRLELGGLSTAVLLARGGFYERTGGQWAYVVDASGEFAVKRKISLGRQNPEVYEVLGGLEVGERVITSSYETYGDNIDKLVLK